MKTLLHHAMKLLTFGIKRNNFFSGKCPSYNSYQGNMDEKDCSTDYNGECPNELYKSPLSVRCKHRYLF